MALCVPRLCVTLVIKNIEMVKTINEMKVVLSMGIFIVGKGVVQSINF